MIKIKIFIETNNCHKIIGKVIYEKTLGDKMLISLKIKNQTKY